MQSMEEMLSEKYERLIRILNSNDSSASDKRWAEEQLNQVIEELKPYRENCKTILKEKGIGLALTCIPVVLYWTFYFRAQRNVLEFEQSGSIRSTAGRDLKLPKFFKI